MGTISSIPQKESSEGVFGWQGCSHGSDLSATGSWWSCIGKILCVYIYLYTYITYVIYEYLCAHIAIWLGSCIGWPLCNQAYWWPMVWNGLEPGDVEEWSVPYPEAVERIPLYGGGQGRCTTEMGGSDVEIFTGHVLHSTELIWEDSNRDSLAFASLLGSALARFVSCVAQMDMAKWC